MSQMGQFNANDDKPLSRKGQRCSLWHVRFNSAPDHNTVSHLLVEVCESNTEQDRPVDRPAECKDLYITAWLSGVGSVTIVYCIDQSDKG